MARVPFWTPIYIRLGVIGLSRAGKTQLVETLMGLRPCPPDEYVLGGLPLQKTDRQGTRARFAYAAQDVRLLAGSVAENLRLADLWRQMMTFGAP